MRANQAWLALGLLVACGGSDKSRDSGGVTLTVTMTNTSAPGSLVPSVGDPQDQTLAPGLLVLHTPGWSLFEAGQAPPYPALEALVEDGDNAPLYQALSADPDVLLVESFAALDGDYNAVPMHPDDSATLTVDLPPGSHLTLVAMLGQSNDVFVAVRDVAPSGPLTPSLWDAGTEVNEEPGAGPNQAPRQAAAGDGAAEGGTPSLVQGADPGGFAWPAADSLVSIVAE